MYDDAASKFSTKDAIIMGDFNADCSYILKGEWKCARDPSCNDVEIKLWNEDKFKWWVDDDADTTTSSTDCAYDRIVTVGSFFEGAIQQKDVSVFDFQSWLSLSEQEMKDVSDHYPVEALVQFESSTRIAFAAQEGTCMSKTGSSLGILKGFLSQKDCQKQCIDDVGCNAFGMEHSIHTDGKFDCMFYYGDEIYGNGAAGGSCYVKYEEIVEPDGGDGGMNTVVIAGAAGGAAVLLFAIVYIYRLRRRVLLPRNMRKTMRKSTSRKDRARGPERVVEFGASSAVPPGVSRSAPTSMLPPGWIACFDEVSGETYYWNESSGETTWDRPSAQPHTFASYHSKHLSMG